MREVAPRWAELFDKDHQLYLREEEILAEFKLIAPTINQLGSYHPVGPPAAPEPEAHPASIINLLQHLTPKRVPRPQPMEVEPELQARGRALSEELATVREARRLLAPEIRREHLAGSHEWCKRVTPEYDALVSRVCAAMAEFGDAWLDHQAWIDEVKREGAAFAMLRLLFPVEDTSLFPLLYTLQWAVESGHIDRDVIPKSWTDWSLKQQGVSK